MSRSDRLLTCMLAGLFVFAAAVPSGAAGRDKFNARGATTLFDLSTGELTSESAVVQVDATSNWNGNFPTGKFSVTDYSTNPPTYIDGVVICLAVEGNSAQVIGEVRNMRPQPVPPASGPREVVIYGRDNDEQEPDLADELGAATSGSDFPDFFCGGVVLPTSPTDGEVEIIDN